MNVKELFTDDDAVSPVIGVILMVAITVILAAVIGAFVLNIGGSQESAPQVTWDWSDDPSANTVSLKHGGGDKVKNPSQIHFNDKGNGSYSTNGLDAAGPNPTLNDDSGISGSMSAGKEITVLDGGSSDIAGTIELIWESSDGSDSQILNTHEYDTT